MSSVIREPKRYYDAPIRTTKSQNTNNKYWIWNSQWWWEYKLVHPCWKKQFGSSLQNSLPTNLKQTNLWMWHVWKSRRGNRTKMESGGLAGDVFSLPPILKGKSNRKRGTSQVDPLPPGPKKGLPPAPAPPPSNRSANERRSQLSPWGNPVFPTLSLLQWTVCWITAFPSPHFPL